MAESDNNLRAWWAVKNMSEAIGADLSKDLRRGLISIDEISEIVLTCEDCPQAGACEKALRLASSLGHELSEPIKLACPNRETFEAYARQEDLLTE